MDNNFSRGGMGKAAAVAFFRCVALVSSNLPSRIRVKAARPVKPLQGNDYVGECGGDSTLWLFRPAKARTA
jgi:hypothetical protein